MNNRPAALFTRVTNKTKQINRREFNLLLKTVEQLQQSMELDRTRRPFRLLEVADEDEQTAYLMRGGTTDTWVAKSSDAVVQYSLWKYDRYLLRDGCWFQAWWSEAEGKYIPFGVDLLVDFVTSSPIGGGGGTGYLLLDGEVDERYEITLTNPTGIFSTEAGDNDGVGGTARWDINEQAYKIIQLDCESRFAIESSQSSGEA